MCISFCDHEMLLCAFKKYSDMLTMTKAMHEFSVFGLYLIGQSKRQYIG